MTCEELLHCYASLASSSHHMSNRRIVFLLHFQGYRRTTWWMRIAQLADPFPEWYSCAIHIIRWVRVCGSPTPPLALLGASRGTLRTGNDSILLWFTTRSSPKESEVWWRCRELNPGPTCRERARTVMSLSVLPAIRKRRRTAERGDAVCLLRAHQGAVHLADDASSP